MTEIRFPPGALGHLCDDFQDLPDRQTAIRDVLAFIRTILPNHIITDNEEFSAAGEHDYFCAPPLNLNEAEDFVDSIRAWAKQENYDFCPCYLLMRIEELRELKETP